ncbi:N-acetyltransferase [Leisingera sp. NJS204]|uniref:N-acetyltransferase n=1 Tax=Leisingera sp. NJS204 TaxID=2508307 RepID=UPI0020C7F14B|nr:N-acetyltransferase [Leisingera sp. NJS204]
MPALTRRSFAYIDGRIDQPSSMHRLTVDLRKDLYLVGSKIRAARSLHAACIFLISKTDRLYLGKLAADPARHGSGRARQIEDLAAKRVRDPGLPALELLTRVELVENHRSFDRLGFFKTAEGAYPGCSRVTGITMRLAL